MKLLKCILPILVCLGCGIDCAVISENGSSKVNSSENSAIERGTENASANDVVNPNSNEDFKPVSLETIQRVKSVIKRCAKSYGLNCFKMDAITFVERLGKNTDWQVWPGVSIVSDSARITARDARSRLVELANAAEEKPEQLNEMLADQVSEYVKSLKLNLSPASLHLTDDSNRQAKAARKKPNKNAGILSLIQQFSGTIMWVALSGLMLVATKALGAALIALVLSCFHWYRGGGDSHANLHKATTTYEIVAKPLYNPQAEAIAIQHDPNSAASAGAPSAAYPSPYSRNMEYGEKPILIEVQNRPQEAAADMPFRAQIRSILRRQAK